MSLIPRWLRKPFCFPCERRTALLQDALDASKKALDVRVAAINNLKESINERSATAIN